MRNRSNVILWAGILIGIGIILLLDNLGLIGLGIAAKLLRWQLILLIIGIKKLYERDFIPALILILIATVFYLPEFFTSAQIKEIYKFWPVVLILLGILMILRYILPPQSKSGFHPSEVDGNFINISHFMGGSNQKIVSKYFEGGKINCMWGGADLDFNEAQLAKGANLDVFVLMGGLQLRIPKDWNVKLNVSPIAGGVEDKITKFPSNVVDPDKVLVLSGTVIMGGVEIKRY